MKLCSKCGAYNADERQYCVDCTERLEEPLSADEEAKVNEKISGTIHELYQDDENPLRVTPFDKMLVVLTVIFAIIAAAFGVLFLCTGQRWLYGFFGVIAVPVTVFVCLKPQTFWRMVKYQFRNMYSNWNEATPTDGILVYRRCVAVFVTVFMLTVSATAVLQFAYPPVTSYIEDVSDAALESTDWDEHIGVPPPKPIQEMYSYVITEKPVKWQILLNRGSYTVEVLVEHLEDRLFVPGYAWLEMLTITEIIGMEFKESYLDCDSADAFLQDYYAFIDTPN